MNWRDRIVIDELRVDKYTINDIIVNYITNKFYVNRRYQRKLVWEIEEKRLLIDSILKGIPLPAVLIAQYKLKEGNNTILEIVDGLQRLETIKSFILCEFSIEHEGEHKYFNPNANNETFNLLMDKKLKMPDNVLPKELCQEMCRYEIPAIITGQDDKAIELIFSRINSTGRKISSQDLRQSMAVGEFPDLVRRIASRVRKDYTHDDRICLCDMKKISVGPKKYGYGVDIESIFWRRHDLINKPNIKESRDEEIIETLVATVLLKGDFKKNKNNLDDLYNTKTYLGKNIEDRVCDMGKDELEDKFASVFDYIDTIFESVKSDFSSYLFSERKISNKDECFKILFLALYRLISEGYTITDYVAVAKAIKNADTTFNEFTEAKKVDYARINKAVENLYMILKNSFSYEVVTKDAEFQKEIDKRLSYSKIERQLTEFKVCISNFNSQSINMNTIKDISKALVGMSNISDANEEGIVIVGIADSSSAYKEWYKIFKEQAVIINQHYVPGISSEAKKLCGNTDAYYRRLRKLIECEPISDKLKTYILENFEPFDYHGVELMIFKSKNVGETSLYDKEKYIRNSNETIRVSGRISSKKA